MAIFTPPPFYVKTCSLAILATGEKASSLVDLRNKIANISLDSIHYHFWASRMNPHLSYSHYHNDFSKWIHDSLEDQILAETLSIIDPTEFSSLEALRNELVEHIDRRLDDYQIIEWVHKENCFHFIKSSISVFDSSVVIMEPKELTHAVSHLPPSSIFYHFIDAKRRGQQKDDFSLWLQLWNDQYAPLIDKMATIDSYFLTLIEIREKLKNIFKEYFRSEKN